MVSCCNGSMQRRVCAIGHKVVHTSLCRSVAARQFLAAQVRSRAWVPRAVASVPWRVHGWCGVGPAGRSRLSHSPKPPSPPRQRVRRGTRGGSGRRRRRHGGAAAGGGGDVTKVGRSEKWCGSVFQRLFAAAACVPPAGRVVRAPLRRATVPGRTRACLHGHFRSRTSGRRAGAERGGCMRGAGGGRGDADYLTPQNRPPLPPQRVRRGTRGGSGRRRRRRGGAAAGGGGDVTKVGMSVKWCGSVFQRLFAAAACVPPAGRVVRAPLRRATVPGRTRACLHGHFRSRKSGRRAGAEHGCMRRACAVRVGVGPTTIFFGHVNAHCRALVRWNGDAQAEAAPRASAPGACCPRCPHERRRFVGPWMCILDRKHLLFRPKIRFHGPSAIVPCVQHVVRAGTAGGSGGGRSGDRARSGGHGGWSEVESTENCQNNKTGNPETLYIAITYYS